MASENKSARKTKIFISYSRKNLPFVRKLNAALDAAGMNAWVDWEGIPPSADWMEEIQTAIQGSDAFLFVISPYSLKSKVCLEELELGIKYNKKIIPVLFTEPAKEEKLHPKLASIQWVRMRSKVDDFNDSISKLLESVQTDLEWVQRHTRLLQRAAEWVEKKRNKSYLLQGSEIEDSERWMAESTAAGGRIVLPLQAEYINASRRMAVQRQRNLTFVIGVAFLISIFLGIYAFVQKNTALASEQSAKVNEQKAKVNEQNAIHSQSTAIANEWARARQEAIAKENEQIAKAQRSASEARIYQDKAGELDISTLLAVDAYHKLSGIPDQQLRSSLVQAENILRHNISLLAEPVNQMDVGAHILDIVMSLDRKKFVSVDLGGKACVWKTDDGTKLFCAQHEGVVYDAVFSKDGDVLITGAEKGGIAFWNAQTGARIKSLPFKGGSVWDLVLSPDGRWLGVGMSARASLVDMKDMTEQLYFARSSEVKVVAFDPSGRYLALGSSDGYVSIWALQGGWRAGPRHKNEVTDLAFSPDGVWLISAGMDSAVRATKIVDGGQKYSIIHGDWVGSVAFGPDPSWFVTASDDNFVRIIDTATGQEHMRMAHADFAAQAHVSPDGRWIASTGSDRTARVWDAASGAEVLQIPIGGIGSAIQFNSDATRLIVGDESGAITLWDISRLSLCTNSIRSAHFVDEARFSPNGEWLAVNSDDKNIRLIASDQLNNISGMDQKPLVTTKGLTSSIIVSADSKWIAALEYDRENEEYNRVVVSAVDGAPIFLENDGEVIQALAFMPDNDLAVAYEGGAIFIWDVASRQKTLFQQLDEQVILSIAVAPDGKYLAAGLEEANYSLVWDVAAKKQVATLLQAGKISTVQFSRDKKMLATGSSEATVYLWYAANGSFKRLSGFDVNGEVSSMEFGPDNKTLAVGDSAGYVYLLDTALGQEVARMPHVDKLTSVSFSPDGKQLAVVARKAVQIWDLPDIPLITRERLAEIACSRLIKNMDRSKWELLFFEEEYRLICPNLPAGKN